MASPVADNSDTTGKSDNLCSAPIILLFASAGLAYGNLTANLAGLEESKTLVGWAGGLGMEVGFTPNWTAKVEYLYMDLGSRSFSVTGVDNGLQAS